MITEIGDYAFKNCGLKSVYAYTVVPIQINQNTFDYDGVDLYAPANSFYAYYLNTQWSQFLNVKEFDALYTNWYMPKNTDLEIDTDKPIQSEDEEIAADGDMNPGSGLIITGDGEQEVNELVMDCENGESYPSVIENNNLNVEELTFKINVRPGRWYFFSFPFDVVLKDIIYTGKSVWRYYDGETRAANGVGGWKNTVGEILKANQGYIFQCNKAGVLEIPIPNPEFSNSPEKEVPLQSIEAKNPQDASWNFIGNPNLSYYGIDDMAEKFDAPITVWNDEQQTYTAIVPGDDEYHFHPFEAFFVQTPENVDNMTFEDENRVTYVQSKKKEESGARSMTRGGQTVNEKRMLVNLTVSDGQTTDKTRIIFNDDNKLTYETGRDANKFMSLADVPQIYTIDAQNVKYSVNARPNDNRQVRLGFVASSDGNYTIAAERMDCSMALKDNQTGTIHQLDGKPYTFYSEAGTFDNRFTLMSGANITSISANGLEGIDGFNVAAMDGGIVVTGANEGDLNVYNANGVKTATLQGSGTINLNNGTYIVTYAGKSAKIAVK
jgi:ribosomal protein L23